MSMLRTTGDAVAGAAAAPRSSYYAESYRAPIPSPIFFASLSMTHPISREQGRSKRRTTGGGTGINNCLVKVRLSGSTTVVMPKWTGAHYPVRCPSQLLIAVTSAVVTPVVLLYSSERNLKSEI